MIIWHVTTEIAIPGIFTGGMGCHVWNIAREQARLGHYVNVFCPLKSSEYRDGVAFTPWAYHVPKFEHECSFQVEAARRTVAKLFSECEIKPDIIHCHEWDAAPVALDLALFLGAPCISTLHLSNTLNQEFMTPHFQELHSYYLWWEQEMFRRSDATIAISEHYANWIKLFNHGKPIRTIHNGVDIDSFVNGVEKQKPDNRILAFFHGRLCGQKGLDIIARAARQTDDIYWVIAGPMAAKEDGRCMEDGLLSELKGLEHSGKLLMPGMLSQAEIGAWLRACDVAVYPHRRAPFDCAVLEAMACGAAIVTTGVDAITEYCEKDVDAHFISPDPDCLLMSIMWLMNNPERRKRLGVFARQKAKQFSWQQSTKETIEFYDEVIHGKNKTGSTSADRRGQASGILLDQHC